MRTMGGAGVAEPLTVELTPLGLAMFAGAVVELVVSAECTEASGAVFRPAGSSGMKLCWLLGKEDTALFALVSSGVGRPTDPEVKAGGRRSLRGSRCALEDSNSSCGVMSIEF